MPKPHLNKTKYLFLTFAFLGLFLVTLESFLALFHTSTCHTQGCTIAFSQTRFGELSLLIPAIIVFFTLFILSLRPTPNYQNLIDITLITALAAEGFLMGHEFFRAQTMCPFCLAVFFIIFILGILRTVLGRRQVFLGFTCFITVFSLFYLIQPQGKEALPPLKKDLVLIYSEECSHCKEVIEECERCNVQVCTVSADECYGILKALNIDEVPVLFVNKKDEKNILVGERKIREYLLGFMQSPFESFTSPIPSIPNNHNNACKVGERCNG